MASGGTLNDILNFIMPILVWALLIYIIYRIPIVREGVAKLINWYQNRKSGSDNQGSSGGSYKTTIGYE